MKSKYFSALSLSSLQAVPSISFPYSLFHFYSILYLFFVFTPLTSTFAADPPFILPKTKELRKIKSALITTNKGSMRFELFPEEAPWHVANFKYLADKKFYRGLKFNLYYPRYLIQGGEPVGNSGPGYSLPPEFASRKHEFGTLGMARRQDFMNSERRSNGSQFHIILGNASNLDGSYSIFGQLVDGADVLTLLGAGDTIEDITVFIRD